MAPINVDELDADQLAELVAAASDAEITETVRAIGVDTALDRIFGEMPERFKPDKAPRDVDLQFVVTDEGTEYPYAVRVTNGRCRTARERVEDPRVSLRTELATFLRLITGQASGTGLFMSGKLKVSGDLMFASGIMHFFELPEKP